MRIQMPAPWFSIVPVLLHRRHAARSVAPRAHPKSSQTPRALEEGIEGFAGCAVVISHDRYFLDRICTHILAFEGDSQAYWFEGTYSEYEENRKKRLGDEGPKRIKYRKLVRG